MSKRKLTALEFHKAAKLPSFVRYEPGSEGRKIDQHRVQSSEDGTPLRLRRLSGELSAANLHFLDNKDDASDENCRAWLAALPPHLQVAVDHWLETGEYLYDEVDDGSDGG